MDNVKQTGKQIKGKHEETDQNTRRIARLYPKIDRTVDALNPGLPYKMEFHKTGQAKRARLNLYFREFNEPCLPFEPQDFASMAAVCPQFGPADGLAYPEHDAVMTSNLGGFVQTGVGYIVPFDGIYQIHFTNGVGGVAVGATVLYASIRVNGGIIDQTVYPSTCGVPCFFGPNVDMTSTVSLAAGDVVAGYLAAVDVAFYTPSDICLGNSGITITLVGGI